LINQGIIIRGVGSFYYVMDQRSGEIIQCRAKGIFRSKKIVPTVGDVVLYENSEHGDGVIEDILPRKSYLLRPMIANATCSVIVCAIKSPDLSTVLLDKMLINNAVAGLERLICFNKADLATEEERVRLRNLYSGCGAKILFTSTITDEGIDELSDYLNGKISVFTGVSGSGKSSLLNKIVSDVSIQTGEISEKLKRGKHTTRHSELLILNQKGYVMDTPGFSDLLLTVDPGDIWKYYPEFYPFSDCRYSNCLHLKEPGCMVKQAVNDLKIPEERYRNYGIIYDETMKNYKRY